MMGNQCRHDRGRRSERRDQRDVHGHRLLLPRDQAAPVHQQHRAVL